MTPPTLTRETHLMTDLVDLLTKQKAELIKQTAGSLFRIAAVYPADTYNGSVLQLRHMQERINNLVQVSAELAQARSFLAHLQDPTQQASDLTSHPIIDHLYRLTNPGYEEPTPQ